MVAADGKPSFTGEVQPLLNRYCMDCHNSRKNKGGFNLESLEAIRRGGKHGKVIVPGDPAASRLILALEGKVKHPDLVKKQGRKPTDKEIQVFRAWIESGARGDDEVP